MENLSRYRVSFSIFLVWLFTISGILGILSEASEWFISLTPLNLIVTFVLLLWNIETLNRNVLLALSIPFFLGFITEALGVNFGLIFGEYAYGENLGFKIFGVPVIICLNWALLTVVTADIAKTVFKNIWITSLVGALLMTGLDVIIEVSAPRFDYWEFNNGIVPLQNYFGWLITAFVAHRGYQMFKIKSHKVLSWHIFISITIFFATFLIFR